MGKELATRIEKLKANSTEENKKNFIVSLITESLFVPVIMGVEEGSNNISKMSYYSIKAESGDFLLAFTSIEAMGTWKKESQFLELGFKEICGIVELAYSGVVIDNAGNSMALKKDFIEKVKGHIKDKRK